MSEVEIEFGPLLKNKRKVVGRASKWPWDKMPLPQKVGNEVQYARFFVPGQSKKKFASVAYAAGRRLGRLFSVEEVNSDSGESGVLVQCLGEVTPDVLEKRHVRATKRAQTLAAKAATN